MIHKLILWNKITNEMKMARSTGDYFLILWKWVSCQSKGTLIYSGWLWPTLGENGILYNWHSLFSFPTRYFFALFPNPVRNGQDRVFNTWSECNCYYYANFCFHCMRVLPPLNCFLIVSIFCSLNEGRSSSLRQYYVLGPGNNERQLKCQ